MRARLIGAWELVNFVMRDMATNAEKRPRGGHPLGLILYTHDGYVFAQLQRPGHAHLLTIQRHPGRHRLSGTDRSSAQEPIAAGVAEAQGLSAASVRLSQHCNSLSPSCDQPHSPPLWLCLDAWSG